MPPEKTPASDTSDREIVSMRVFPFPRELVVEAFSDPRQLAQWWGPKGFTNTIEVFDLKPGGTWRLVMHGPAGADYHNESIFIEVVKPERIVFQHLEPVHRFQMTMVFAGHGDETTLTWRMLFDATGDCTPIRNFISDANEQNFDRLAAHLSRIT